MRWSEITKIENKTHWQLLCYTMNVNIFLNIIRPEYHVFILFFSSVDITTAALAECTPQSFYWTFGWCQRCSQGHQLPGLWWCILHHWNHHQGWWRFQSVIMHWKLNFCGNYILQMRILSCTYISVLHWVSIARYYCLHAFSELMLELHVKHSCTIPGIPKATLRCLGVEINNK